jgi:hypothetical protein
MMRRPNASRLAPLLALPPLLALAACGPNLADHAAKAPAFDRPGEAKCGVAKSQSEPLVVEWPSAARAKLEALSRTGVVAVRYTGCEMEVLASCNAPGKYAYTAITPKHDHVAIHNEDDLYANIPLGAAKLEGKLASAGELDVDMSIVGRYASDRAVVTADQLQGPDCAKATHVVSALTVGAFDFSAGAGATVSGGAAVGNAGAGGSSSSTREMLNSDGRMAACDAATTSDGKPPEACGAILRLEVVPLGQAKQEVPVGAPQAAQVAAGGESTVGAAGDVEIDVPEKDQTFTASIEAGGKPFACPEPVTYYKPCHLSGLPEGEAHLKLTGTSVFDRDVPVTGYGRTKVAVAHRGIGEEVTGAVFTAVGGGMIAFAFLNGGGLNDKDASGNDNGSMAVNIVFVTIGGIFGLAGVLGLLGGVLTSHDSVNIEIPGKPAEQASQPALQWGGFAAPTTLRF